MKEINFVYDYLKKHNKGTFKEIWKAVNKKFALNRDKMGNLYTAMVMDARFFYKNDRNWYLKSAVSLDEIKSQSTSLIQEDEIDEFDLFENYNDNTNENDDEEIIVIEDSYDDGNSEDIASKTKMTAKLLKELED